MPESFKHLYLCIFQFVIPTAINSQSLRRCSSVLMGTNGIFTEDHLRHIESLATFPSGAGKISHLRATNLGECLSSEEHDLVFPTPEFSDKALVPSTEKVCLFVC